jgi:hypothetical protein
VDDIAPVNDMNSVVRNISDILYKNAFEVYGRSVLIRDNANPERPNNEWFDEKCATARRNFHSARNFFQRHPSDANRHSYISARNLFNKTKRKAQAISKRRNGIELCKIAKTEPRKFCSAVGPKRKTKCVVDNETISKYFENVLGADPPELSEEVLNLINNDQFENVDVDALDSEITEDDIIKAIAKLKPEKSAGSDNIIGEIFTASPIFFAPLLKKLFNYIFNHGIYPDIWTECLVIPVPNIGDLSDPNNYRPVVLVGVLSKLLTSILTERLLSWSEDEGKLINNQFGFRPGRSTVDAIFILHGIISNILQNKLKLYSAFVEFRKAFDKLNRKILFTSYYVMNLVLNL